MPYLSSKNIFDLIIFFCNINVSSFIKGIEANNELSAVDITPFQNQIELFFLILFLYVMSFVSDYSFLARGGMKIFCVYGEGKKIIQSESTVFEIYTNKF